MVEPAVILLLCFFSSVVRADGPGDENSVAAVVKTMMAKQELRMTRQEEQTREQFAQLKDEMEKKERAHKYEVTKKDATIATLTAALENKRTDHKQVQLTAGLLNSKTFTGAATTGLPSRMCTYRELGGEYVFHGEMANITVRADVLAP